MESECATYLNLKNPKLKYFTLKVKLVNNYNYFFFASLRRLVLAIRLMDTGGELFLDVNKRRSTLLLNLELVLLDRNPYNLAINRM